MQEIKEILDKILNGDYNVRDFAGKSTIPETKIYSWVKYWKKTGKKPEVSFVDGVKMYLWANPGVGQMPINLKEYDQPDVNSNPPDQHPEPTLAQIAKDQRAILRLVEKIERKMNPRLPEEPGKRAVKQVRNAQSRDIGGGTGK